MYAFGSKKNAIVLFIIFTVWHVHASDHMTSDRQVCTAAQKLIQQKKITESVFAWMKEVQEVTPHDIVLQHHVAPVVYGTTHHLLERVYRKVDIFSSVREVYPRRTQEELYDYDMLEKQFIQDAKIRHSQGGEGCGFKSQTQQQQKDFDDESF